MFLTFPTHVFENACDEHWIIGTVTHYKTRYIGIVNELLTTLMDAGDYAALSKNAAAFTDVIRKAKGLC